MKRLLAGLFCMLVMVSSGAGQIIVDGNIVGLVIPDRADVLAGVPIPSVLNFAGGGARAAGMGNAFLAVSDDVTAVSWNPASLFRFENALEQPVVGLSFSNYMPNGEFKFGDVNVQTFEADDVLGGVGVFSFVAPVRVKGHPFVASLSYTRVGDEFWNGGARAQDFVQWNSADVEAGTEHLLATSSTTDQYASVYNLNIGFGTRVYQNLSFGISANLYKGSGVRNNLGVTERHGFPLANLQRVLLVERRTRVDSSQYSGMSFTFGWRYTRDKLNAALVMTMPHTLKVETDVTYEVLSSRNGLVIEEGTETFYYDENIKEVEIPINLGGGLSYQLKENWLWSLDAEYCPFSGKKVNVRDSILLVSGEKDKEFFTPVDPHWNNVFEVRLGTEYLWNTGSDLVPVMPLRAGFGYGTVPAPGVEGSMVALSDTTSTFVSSFTKDASTSFSFGTGVHWDQIHIDLAFQHSSVTQEAFDFGPNPDDPTQVLAYPYEVSNSANTFQVMFTGFF